MSIQDVVQMLESEKAQKESEAAKIGDLLIQARLILSVSPIRAKGIRLKGSKNGTINSIYAARARAKKKGLPLPPLPASNSKVLKSPSPVIKRKKRLSEAQIVAMRQNVAKARAKAMANRKKNKR